MDRTSEFFDTVNVLRIHGGVAASPLAALAQANAAPSSGGLLSAPAASIARGTKRAARQAERAHRLANVRGLFNDPAAELAELSGVLKSDLRALDTALEALSAGAAAERDGEPSRGSPRAHWVAVTDALRERVLAVTRRFQDALRARAATIADTGARRRTLAHSAWAPEPLPDDSPLFAPVPQPEAAAADATSDAAPAAAPNAGGPENATGARAVPKYLRRRGAAGPTAGSNALPMPVFSAGPSNPGGGFGGLSAQSLATMHDARARAQDARSVEGTIAELGGMFTRMAALVAEQGDVIARIDADTEDAAVNVEAGAAELAKFYASVKANRGLILKLFAVLVFVILLFAIFRPSKSK